VVSRDNEIDGEKMYPARQKNPSEAERYQAAVRIPSCSCTWAFGVMEKFLSKPATPEFNKQLKTTQFAIFMATAGCIAASTRTTGKATGSTETASNPFDDPERFGKAVLLPTFTSRRECNARIATFGQDITETEKIYWRATRALKLIASLATAPSVRVRASSFLSCRAWQVDAVSNSAHPLGLRRLMRADTLMQRP